MLSSLVVGAHQPDPPASMGLNERVHRAVRITERLNRIPYDDADGIRAAWSELTERPVDPTFNLIPPVYSDCGYDIRIGREVFINQACMLMGLGGIEIGDRVMIGPGVRLISAGHPVDPDARRTIVAAPIRIEQDVWIGAGATVLQGVTVGRDSVVAAGAVVTRDVDDGTLVAGIPARAVRSVYAPER